MVHKIEQSEEKPAESEEITLGKVASFYKNVFNEFKPKKQEVTVEGELKEKRKAEEEIDLDGGHIG